MPHGWNRELQNDELASTAALYAQSALRALEEVCRQGWTIAGQRSELNNQSSSEILFAKTLKLLPSLPVVVAAELQSLVEVVEQQKHLLTLGTHLMAFEVAIAAAAAATVAAAFVVEVPDTEKLMRQTAKEEE